MWHHTMPKHITRLSQIWVNFGLKKHFFGLPNISSTQFTTSIKQYFVLPVIMTGVSNNCSCENIHRKNVTLFKVLLYSQLKAVHAI